MNYKKVCESCNCEYEVSSSNPNHKRQRFCKECGARAWSKGIERVCICPNCGKEFITYRKDKTFCSRSCAVSSVGKIRYKDVVKSHCLGCGKEIAVSRKHCDDCSKNEFQFICKVCNQNYIGTLRSQICSNECRKQLSRKKQKQREERLHNQLDKVCVCKECGKEFKPDYGDKGRVFCNDECAKKHGNRIGKAVRRARIRGAKRVDNIDPLMIFNRDGWKCYLCGKSTPKELRGTHNDRAPELDHIIPLAKGGTHTIDNVACACRRCNQDKSDKVVLPGGMGTQFSMAF